MATGAAGDGLLRGCSKAAFPAEIWASSAALITRTRRFVPDSEVVERRMSRLDERFVCDDGRHHAAVLLPVSPPDRGRSRGHKLNWFCAKKRMRREIRFPFFCKV
ncbi:hypothetical protein DH2020_029715 [Rehmannia glutinosa]|uniref:Uncharacterized protein n=1 Tax=Rehmannia glutinosa TaxID=99300 RepID=A0ABR0VRW4_REHGL